MQNALNQIDSKAYIESGKAVSWALFGGIALLSLSMFLVSYLAHPKFLTDIRSDSQGLYKTEYQTGQTYYCQAENNKEGQLVAGSCSLIKNR